MYPLEFENVTKRYGHEVVVDDLTLHRATRDGSPASWDPTVPGSPRR